MIYIDSNVFLLSILYDTPESERCRRFLRRVEAGEVEGATSALAVDEVAWVVLRHAGRASAVEEARRVLRIPNLRLLPVTGADAGRALDLLESCGGLKPRDCLHAACALGHGMREVASDDADLDRVPGLARLAVEEM